MNSLDIPVDEMTSEQLQKRAIKLILIRLGLGSSNLLPVPESFHKLMTRSNTSIGSTGSGSGTSTSTVNYPIVNPHNLDMGAVDLRVVPECINILSSLTSLELYSCKLSKPDCYPDTLWTLTKLQHLNLYTNKLEVLPYQI